MIRILAIGKKHESWVADGIERYQKRLQRLFSVEWVLLPHSSRTGQAARHDESDRIFARLSDDEYVVLLDERGTLLNSSALSALLTAPLEQSKKVTLVVGGAYGVSELLHQRADFVWSLSPLVFPHQLVRLIMSEQIYRAQEIAAGRPYHHE